MAALDLKTIINKENMAINVYEKYECDEVSMEECKSFFQNYKLQHEVKSEFEDDIWIIKNEAKGMFSHIQFNDMLLSYKVKLKKFCSIKLCKQNMSVGYVASTIRTITKVFLYTHGFQEEYLEDFIINFKKIPPSIMQCIRQFLIFVGLGESYAKYLATIKQSKGKSRDIPDFESIILFDKLINDFLVNHEELLDKYYYIVLWWKISTIIPIRPLEFLNMNRDCLRVVDGKKYIHIERKKNKQENTKYETPIMKDFSISDDMYAFVQDYISYANAIDDDQYLISRNIYAKILHKKQNKHRKVTSKEFVELLYRFEKEVVTGVYHIEIVPTGEKTNENQMEKLRLGDTRHLAIINMMMQGVNPLDIMKIAGHHTLDMQVGYYSHVEKFMTSKTFILSKILKEDVKLNTPNIDFALKKIDKDMMGVSYYDLPIVANGNGRCSCTNFPYECERECLFCKYFLAEKNISKEYLDGLQEEKRLEIETKKETLKYILKNADYIEEKQLEQLSKEYAADLNQEVVIQAYRMRKDDLIE